MVESEGRADEGIVDERSGTAGKLLTGVADLRGAEAEMVGSGKQLLEGQAEFVQAADAVRARTSSVHAAGGRAGHFRHLDSSIRCMVILEKYFHTSYGKSLH
ncbi:hypothetical protein ACFQ0Q_49420 [Streptomyces aureus]